MNASTTTVSALPVPTQAQESAPRATIVLDAGHGGDDPGAIGPNGTKEKDINLKIIYELKELLKKTAATALF